MKLTIAQLKALWVTGYTPTQADFDNLFDSYENIIDNGYQVKKVLFSDINGGKSPQTLFNLPLCTLAPNEIITNIFAVLKSIFTYSGAPALTNVILFDLTNSIPENSLSVGHRAPGAPSSLGDSAFLNITCTGSSTTSDNVNMGNLAPLVDFVNPCNMSLQFTDTDLTLLTAGEVWIYYKVETLPTPS